MDPAVQVWDQIQNQLHEQCREKLRKIGLPGLEVFRFLVLEALRGRHPLARVWEQDPPGLTTLHVLFDAMAIGEELEMPELDVRQAVGDLVELGWVELIGNNGNSIIVVGERAYCHARDYSVEEQPELLFHEQEPRFVCNRMFQAHLTKAWRAAA